MTHRNIIEAFAESLEEIRRVILDDSLSKPVADALRRHDSHASEALELLSSLQERIVLASHQLFGKSAEKCSPTSTEATAVFSALFGDLVDLGSTPREEPKSTSANDGLAPCGDLNQEDVDVPCAETCQIVMLACVVDHVLPSTCCSDQSSFCTDLNESSDKSDPRSWQGDWLFQPKYTDEGGSCLQIAAAVLPTLQCRCVPHFVASQTTRSRTRP